MSFTVVIKNNEDGKILFASENTKAMVFGAVADDGEKEDVPAAALACGCSGPSDLALAIALGRRAIDDVEKNDVLLLKCRPLAEMFIERMAAKQGKKEGSEND